MNNFPAFLGGAEKRQLNGLSAPFYFFDKNSAASFFEKLIDSKDLGALRILSMSPGVQNKSLLFFFDGLNENSPLHVEVNCEGLNEIPSIREIWPVASWWEDELERQRLFHFSISNKVGGIQWQQ
jgi:hypothetical protein